MEPAIRTANLGDLEAVQRIARAAYALYVRQTNEVRA